MPKGVYRREYRPLAQVIEEKCVPITESGCWIWIAYTLPSGYGELSHGGLPPRFAHRLSFSAFVGPIPEGMDVCHKCDTPACVNPSHLFLGTARDNANDMVRKMRSYVAFEKAKTYCKRGHELSGSNLYIHKNSGRRQCKACVRIMSRERYKCKGN